MMFNAHVLGLLLPVLCGPVEGPALSHVPAPALEIRLKEAVARPAGSQPERQVQLDTRWQDSLLQPDQNRRPDSFNNRSVEQAPKTWPFPMVVSPGRPVLPGSAW
jgi:hypothetical protein